MYQKPLTKLEDAFNHMKERTPEKITAITNMFGAKPKGRPITCSKCGRTHGTLVRKDEGIYEHRKPCK
jgi:hypothetical protein